MIDYVEGILTVKKHLKDLERALTEHRGRDARELCTEIVVAARLLSAQIKLQYGADDENNN